MAGRARSGWKEDRRGWLIALCVSAAAHAGIYLHFLHADGSATRPDIPPRVALSVVLVPATVTSPVPAAMPVAPAPVPARQEIDPAPPAQPVPRRAPRPAALPEPAAVQAEVPPPLPQKLAALAPPAAGPAALDLLPLEPPRADAAYLNNPPPTYPKLLLRRGVEGSVLVRAEVGSDGHCSQVLLQQSSGFLQFDAAALAAVKNWRFVPARQGETTVVAWVDVPIDFRITRAR